MRAPPSPKQPPSPTLRFYRRIALRGWRNSDYFTYTWRYAVVRDWVASQLPRASAILSVGCGTGELERHLRALGHRVVGLDMSHEMLRSASQHGMHALVRADGNSLPFRKGCFDTVILWESIGHLRMAAAFGEARRVLRKGGRLILSTYPGHWPAHGTYRARSPRTIERGLASAGFRVRESKLLRIDARRVREVDTEWHCALVYIAAEAMGIRDLSIKTREGRMAKRRGNGR